MLYTAKLLFVILLLCHAFADTCPAGGNTIPEKESDVLYFTHIPKAGGRAVSYWLGTTYGANEVFEESRPASIFSSVAKQLRAQHPRALLSAEIDNTTVANRKLLQLQPVGQKGRMPRRPKAPVAGKDETLRTETDFSGVKVAFSHDRPDIADKVFRALNDQHTTTHLMTFLRDVHSHRVSMVEKYVTSVLTKEWKKKNPGKKKSRKLTYKDWVYLDGANVDWKDQTYAQPQTGTQLIGVKNLGLNGARSYQLKWVARGRNNEAAECGGNDQIATETCQDDKLLQQGKQALMEDYAFFGLLDRFADSVCLLHYHTRKPIPEGRDYKCAANFRSPCLRVNACTSDYVCPPENAEANIHQYKNQDWRETDALINLVEGPEVEFYKWAEEEFERRFQAAKADVKCQINSGALTGDEKWHHGCWQ